ncbi:hypothetical protein [Methanolobus chelungpuianus]|uniref:Uracil-DNA glycosylase-like domain-containing protein n=1 Tax=Methanolobus chelungpuianus TaxID=502115 RepID=A0AAE3KYH1_9EURY|nr:hypothetical protein [Methanolobus chelungpuianus]MCQ6963682.1 hypothetical protein [Methanolobus chelungpuianus]
MKGDTKYTKDSLKNEAMQDIIKEIRTCDLACYTDRYTFPLNSRINGKQRQISVDELINGSPLVDDWRGQPVLFVSQAPSKQAWVDNELSSQNNSFLTDFLLPKIYPNQNLSEALEHWKQLVFWVHTANCYPFVHTTGRSKGRDKAPDLRCANKYLDRVVNNMKPELIILMGGSSTKFFSSSIRLLTENRKHYPPLKDVLEWQYSNGNKLMISSKNGSKEYRSIVIPHAANWDQLNENEKYAYDLVFQSLKDI